MDALRKTMFTLALTLTMILSMCCPQAYSPPLKVELNGGELIYLKSRLIQLTSQSRLILPQSVQAFVEVDGIQPPTFTFTVDVHLNDMVVPHLYDWSFDGQARYIQVANSPSLNPTMALSITTRMKSPMETSGHILLCDKNWDYSYCLMYNWERVWFYVWASGKAFRVTLNLGEKGITSNKWCHFAVVCNASVGWTGVYRNATGVAWNTRSPWTIATYDCPIRIGQTSTVGCTGRVERVCLFDIALSSTDVLNDYNNIITGRGLKMFLDATFFDGSKYIDLSGNNNHGVPYNNPLRVQAEVKYASIVRGRFSDGKVHFMIPQGFQYTVRGQGGGIVASGVAQSILDVQVSQPGTYTLELKPCVAGNVIDFYSLWLGNPPTGLYSAVKLYHVGNGSLMAFFEPSTYDGSVVRDIWSGLTATPQYIGFPSIGSSTPAVSSIMLDARYLYIGFLPAHTPVTLFYGGAAYTYNYSGGIIAFQLPERPVQASINLVDGWLYIALEKSSRSVPIPQVPVSPSDFIGGVKRIWGDASYIVLALLPMSIWLKKRSPTLVAGSLLILAAINMVSYPSTINTILFLAATLASAIVLYTVLWGGED